MTPVRFYRTELDNEPVRDWLKKLDRIDRKIIGDDLQTVQLGWKTGLIGEPLVKNIGSGLFEIRTSLPSHRIARVLFCTYGDEIVLLHGFIKKTQKISSNDLELAKKRQRSLKVNLR